MRSYAGRKALQEEVLDLIKGDSDDGSGTNQQQINSIDRIKNIDDTDVKDNDSSKRSKKSLKFSNSNDEDGSGNEVKTCESFESNADKENEEEELDSLLSKSTDAPMTDRVSQSKISVQEEDEKCKLKYQLFDNETAVLKCTIALLFVDALLYVFDHYFVHVLLLVLLLGLLLFV